jgi:large subunit ribosomal protein L5
MNRMEEIRIEKITLNVGAGKDQSKLEKGMILLKTITQSKPVKTFTSKRIPEWGIRPGLPVGCKVTLRKEKAIQLLIRLLRAKDNMLKQKQFDKNGNIAFGIPEYIDIPDIKYDPKIGVMGLEICISLEKPGFRVKRRTFKKGKIGNKHRIGQEEALEFIKNKFGVKIEEE